MNNAQDITKEFDKLLDGLGVENVEVDNSPVAVVIQKYVDIWRKNLDKRKINASHILWQSIGQDDGTGTGWHYEYDRNGKLTGIKLFLKEYYEYTDSGRGASKGSGSGMLRMNLAGAKKWISQKGLIPSSGMNFKTKRKLKDGTVKTYTRHLDSIKANQALSYMISRKIHKFGFSPKFQKIRQGWFSNELKSFEKELVKAIEKEFGQIETFNIKINP